MNKKSDIIEKIRPIWKQFDEIIQPLNLLQIKSFSYIRIFQDQKYLAFSNQRKWLEFHLLNAKNAGLFFSNKANRFSDLQLKHAIWPIMPTDEVLTSLYKHDVWNGISFFRTSPFFTERFCFASTRDDYKITSFYLNNIDLLKRFIMYFRYKSDVLIKGFDPLCLGQYTTLDEDKENLQDDNIIKFTDDACSTGLIRLADGSFANISPQEVQCLKHLANSKSTKAIAKSMGLSINTVGSYIHSIKEKLGCRTRADLIAMYNQYNL